ncbi:uncharacterized protein LOC144470102 isoform X1 [Augochlora pura]
MTSCSGLSGLHDGPLIRPTKRNGRVRPYADTCCAVVAVGNVWLQSRSATEINTECDGFRYSDVCASFRAADDKENDNGWYPDGRPVIRTRLNLDWLRFCRRFKQLKVSHLSRAVLLIHDRENRCQRNT